MQAESKTAWLEIGEAGNIESIALREKGKERDGQETARIIQQKVSQKRTEGQGGSMEGNLYLSGTVCRQRQTGLRG